MGAPTVSAENQNILLGTTIVSTDMFNAVDPDGDPIELVRFRDQNNHSTSGFFTFNNVVQAANTWLTFDYSVLNNLVYNAATSVQKDQVQIQVRAGGQWSNIDTFFMYSVLPNALPPILTSPDIFVIQNEYVLLNQFVSYDDPEGYPVEYWEIQDKRDHVFSGYLELDGVKLGNDVNMIAAEDWGRVRFYAGYSAPNTDPLEIRASDGDFVSDTLFVNAVTSLNANRPVPITGEVLAGAREVLRVRDMFDYSDGDDSTIKKYQFWDTSPHSFSGYFRKNGIQLPSQSWVVVDDDELDDLEFVAANKFFNEQLRVQLNDGRHWSAIETIRVKTNEEPILASDEWHIMEEVEFVDIAPMFRKVDNGPFHTRYEVYDATSDSLSGNLRMGAETLDAERVYSFTPFEFNQLQFKSGKWDDRSHDQIYVRAFNDTFASEWTRLNIRTEPEYLDSLAGTSWHSFIGSGSFGPLDLTYSFMQAYPDYDSGAAPDDEFVIPWNEMRPGARQAYDHLETFTGLRFEEVSDSATNEYGAPGGIIRTGTYCIENTPVVAYAFFPSDPNVDESPQGGDMWFNRWWMGGPIDPPPPNPPCPSSPVPWGEWDPGEQNIMGFSNYDVYMHELGHALGLSHSFDGLDILPLPTESANFTVMSYSPTFSGLPPITYMMYDIVALQQRYGIGSHNEGDTVYSVAEYGDFAATAWDTGGTDTITGEGVVFDQLIDLRPGAFSNLGGNFSNFGIAFGVDIEIGIGGLGNDDLRGNEKDNVLEGGVGNDVLQGYGGNDILTGGKNNDRFLWMQNGGDDTIDEKFGAGRDTIEIGLQLGLDNFTDDLVFSKLGNDLLIDLKIREGLPSDGVLSSGSILIKNQGWGRNRIETLEVMGVAVDLNFLYGILTEPEQKFAVTSVMNKFGYEVAPV